MHTNATVTQNPNFIIILMKVHLLQPSLNLEKTLLRQTEPSTKTDSLRCLALRTRAGTCTCMYKIIHSDMKLTLRIRFFLNSSSWFSVELSIATRCTPQLLGRLHRVKLKHQLHLSTLKGYEYEFGNGRHSSMQYNIL